MYAELSITSNFTFLTGASHPEEFMRRAAEMGLSAIAIADENSVAGIVRAHAEAREIARDLAARAAAEARDGPIGPPVPPGMEHRRAPVLSCAPRLIPAARLLPADGPELTALVASRAGWARLCRLISRGRLRAPKGGCALRMEDLMEGMEGLELLLHPPRAFPAPDDWNRQAARLARRFGAQMHLALSPAYDGQDAARLDAHAEAARRLGLPTLATARPMMHHGRRRRLADVLTAIRTGTRIDVLGRAALANGEGRLRAEAEMRRIFRAHPQAVKRAGALAARCTFSLDALRYEYPSEVAEGESPADRLARLARAGLRWRYPDGPSERVRGMLEHELRLIAKLRYEPYFLTVHDIVAFARSRGILCQGRGSAANSVVCYSLGITSVSPEIGTMVFERFVSEARDEPPDIDVDFEHERREEVIQW
ncbi:MAG: PHP domain-containing protein, partial [Paracoccaceae bacterium]